MEIWARDGFRGPPTANLFREKFLTWEELPSQKPIGKSMQFREVSLLAKCEWAHLCDHAFFDQGGKPCLIGLFRSIFAHRTPTRHTHFVIAFEVSGERGEELDLRIEMHRPDRSDPLFEMENSEVVLNESRRHTFAIGVDNVMLPDFGPYELRISLGETVAYTLTLMVNRMPEQPR